MICFLLCGRVGMGLKILKSIATKVCKVTLFSHYVYTPFPCYFFRIWFCNHTFLTHPAPSPHSLPGKAKCSKTITKKVNVLREYTFTLCAKLHPLSESLVDVPSPFPHSATPSLHITPYCFHTCPPHHTATSSLHTTLANIHHSHPF